MRDALLELVPVRAALAVVEAPQLREVRVLRRQHALVLVLDQLAGEVVQLCNSVENKYFFSFQEYFYVFYTCSLAGLPAGVGGAELLDSVSVPQGVQRVLARRHARADHRDLGQKYMYVKIFAKIFFSKSTNIFSAKTIFCDFFQFNSPCRSWPCPR